MSIGRKYRKSRVRHTLASEHEHLEYVPEVLEGVDRELKAEARTTCYTNRMSKCTVSKHDSNKYTYKQGATLCAIMDEASLQSYQYENQKAQ